MHKVEPVRNLDTVHDIEATLSRLDTPRGRRMFLLWEFGIHTGMRIGDLLKLRVSDVCGQREIVFKPQKQRHYHKDGTQIPQYKLRYPIDPEGVLIKVINARVKGLPGQNPLFPSRKKTPGGQLRPITREQALEDMKEIARICNIKTPFGCHTMRKTFGYHFYQKNHDIAALQKWFHHSAPEITLIYIGIADDNLRKMTKSSPFKLSPDVIL